MPFIFLAATRKYEETRKITNLNTCNFVKEFIYNIDHFKQDRN